MLPSATSCTHPPFLTAACTGVDWYGCRKVQLSCQDRVYLKPSMIHEDTQHRRSDQSFLFSIARKWLQVRRCYPRKIILRIVCGKRNIGQYFIKHLTEGEETIPPVERKFCSMPQLCSMDQKIREHLNCTEVHSRTKMRLV